MFCREFPENEYKCRETRYSDKIQSPYQAHVAGELCYGGNRRQREEQDKKTDAQAERRGAQKTCTVVAVLVFSSNL